MLETDPGSVIGDIPIQDITAPLLLMAMRKIEERGVIETAHRSRGAAAAVFRHAIATGLTAYNPGEAAGELMDLSPSVKMGISSAHARSLSVPA